MAVRLQEITIFRCDMQQRMQRQCLLDPTGGTYLAVAGVAIRGTGPGKVKRGGGGGM